MISVEKLENFTLWIWQAAKKLVKLEQKVRCLIKPKKLISA